MSAVREHASAGPASEASSAVWDDLSGADLTSLVDDGLSAGHSTAVPVYLVRQGGMLVVGSWEEVAATESASASTSSQGSLIRSLGSAAHPRPPTSERVQQLKEGSGLTWDQIRRLFGVSLRAVHMWAGGARMNSHNLERLADLEMLVAGLGVTPDERRNALLGTSISGGRSVFQRQLLSASRPSRIDIEALTESTGAGHTIHGEFLSAEVIDDAGQAL